MENDQKLKKTKSSIDFMSSGGEAGALIRSINWSKTPLGPVSEWSQALSNTIGLMLHNEFPLILWWGPEYVQFYNDAYRPIPGDKHPKSMGQPASECWSEIWHIIGPLIEAPFSGKPASTSDDLFLLMNRKGFLEETHFKIAYSPVPDNTVESTGVGGILGTIAETTEKVYSERQLETLQELGARAAEAQTPEHACTNAAETLLDNQFDIPFALFYLIEDEGTKANLVANCGFKSDGQANPKYINIGNEKTWPLRSVVHQGEIKVIDNLKQKFEHLPLGEWAESPHSAILLPFISPDQPYAYGVLIAGLSPHRKLDKDYRTFFELAASQITTAIRNARAFQEERERAEALEELDKAKTTFFSNVSHEFRTPLTLMLGPLEDLLTEDLPFETNEQVSMVHRNSMRLLKLVNTLLDFSRIESGRIQANYEPTDLSVFTEDLASVFRSAIEKAGMQLNVDCPSLHEPVYVDKEMWEKIVLNLLSNAFKFTFNGEISLSLKWCCDHVELRVKDTGTGITPEEMPHLFERFHRIKSARSRTYEGTGIGLSLVKELVKLHEGTIKAESALSEGTTFIVDIPTGYSHLPKDRIETARTQASTSIGTTPYIEEVSSMLHEDISSESEISEEYSAFSYADGSKSRILLAEDNADMRNYINRLLSKYYEVNAVSNGSEALNVALQNPPDLVLTDIMMPELDGFELLKALRADSKTRTIPIIFLSARAGEEAKVEGIEAGADDYLVKPFSAKELIARVRTNLEIVSIREKAEKELMKARDNLQREFRDINALHQLNTKFIEGDNLNSVLQEVLNTAINVIKADKGNIQLMDSPTGTMKIVGSKNFSPPFLKFFESVYPGESAVCSTAILRLKRVIVEDITNSPIFKDSDSLEVLLNEDVRAVQSTPIVSKDGNLLGIISTHFTKIHVPTERDLRFIDILSRQAAEIIQRKKAEESLKHARDTLEEQVKERTIELEEAIQELEHSNKELQSFAYITSHDLQEPLRTIASFTQLLERRYKGQLDDDADEFMDYIVNAAVRMKDMIQGLLEYSRVDTRSEPFEEFNSGEAVNQALNHLHSSIEECNAKINYENLPVVNGDNHQIVRVFQNLIGNSLKFHKEGVKPEIHVSALKNGGEYIFSIVDNGIGINSEYSKKIFEPFKRLHTIDEYEGTGIGLAVVKRIIEHHSGRIWFESEWGKGSTFYFTIPIETFKNGRHSPKI
jgi:signal transduction histidine kinase/CheY-like chemotaxis protein